MNIDFKKLNLNKTILMKSDLEILHLRKKGHTLQEIADMKNVSPTTVRNRLKYCEKYWNLEKFRCVKCSEIYNPQTYEKLHYLVKYQTCLDCFKNIKKARNVVNSEDEVSIIVYNLRRKFPNFESNKHKVPKEFYIIMSLRLQNNTIQEISDKLGISVSTVNRYLSKSNIEKMLNLINN